MQGVVQPGDHPGWIAERRVQSHVLDPLAVEVNLPSVAQALDVFLTRHGPGLAPRALLIGTGRSPVIGMARHRLTPPRLGCGRPGPTDIWRLRRARSCSRAGR